MTAPADQAVRDQALDPRRSFIVQAPAGSGKTELLAQRYLRLLGREEQPDAVLAITFTRKSAAEMRARVARNLRQARELGEEDSGDADLPSHRRLSLDLARQVLGQSRRRGWDLEDHPARLRIMTIDSLGSWLAASAPVSSGGGALGSLRADPGPLYQQAARELLYEGVREGRQSVETVLRHLDGDGRRFTELVATMLARREQWLDLLAVSESRDPAQALNGALRELVRLEIGRMLDSLGKARRGFEAAFAEHWATGGESPDPGTPEALGGWVRAREALLVKRGQWRARFKDKLDAGLEGELRRREEFRQRLARVSVLQRPACDPGQVKLARAVIRVLARAYAHLKVLFAQRHETDYPEVAGAALKALEPGDRPSLLAERLDRRLRHMLVDEFQDTSPAQIRLLERMVAEWQDGDGRTLFLVGDPMQSIYGFRAADVREYFRVCERGLGNLRPEVLKLTVNFRSVPGLVSWFNKVFPQVFPARRDGLAGAAPYSRCDLAPGAAAAGHETEPSGAEVRLHYFRKRKGDHGGEVEIVRQILDAELDGNPDGGSDRLAILVRTRTHGEEISRALGEEGFPVSRTEFDKRGRFSVVQDLAALARALAQPADRIAWLAVLRAPWCGLTLKDLHALCHDERDLTVWELLNQDERIKRLSADGRKRLASIVPALEKALSLRGQLDFRSWVEGAWLALGGPSGNRDKNAVRHAEEFLDRLGEVSHAGLIDDAVSRTLQLTGEFVSNPEIKAAAQIMTMHKAKGLEFDAVILPGLDRTARGGAKPVLRWWQPSPGGGMPGVLEGPVLAVSPSPGEGGENHAYKYLEALEKAREDAERRRLLYVAATRARKRLHLLVGLTCEEETEGTGEFRPAAGTMAADLQAAVREALQDGEPPILPARPGQPRERRLVPPRILRVPDGWRPPQPPLPVIAGRPEEALPGGQRRESRHPSYAWAGERARLLGLAVHRWLQEIAGQGPDAYPEERLDGLGGPIERMLQCLGAPTGELESLAGDVQFALRNTLSDERGRWTLEAHEEAASELPLSLREKGRIRSLVLDRSFVCAGERWIVDYKTSRHEGGNLSGFLQEEERRYAPQLEDYRLAMQERETRAIRVALYFPWHQAFRELKP